MATTTPSLADVGSSWDHAAHGDAAFEILTDHRRTDEEFLATGEQEIEARLRHLDTFGVRQYDRALDFGCGLGRCTRALAGRYKAAVGLDISPEMVRKAQALNSDVPNVEFVVGNDGGGLPFDDESFDLVFTFLVLQHNPREFQFAYITEMLRVLAPGGMLIIEAPDGPDFTHPNPWLSMWGMPKAEMERVLDRDAQLLGAELLHRMHAWDCWVYYARKP